MKIVIAIVCLLSLCGGGMSFAIDELDVFHTKLSVKHQARRSDESHNGQVEYYYTNLEDLQDIETTDVSSSEDTLGNIVIGPDVKKAYIYTVLPKNFDFDKAFDRKEPISLGNVEVQGKGKGREIVHILEFEGELKFFTQPSVEIGNIFLEKSGAEVENIVIMQGSIYAK